MVAVVSGSGLGLFGSSVTGLGGAGVSGNAGLGRGGDRVYVNTATGNLIVQSQDEVLRALGLDLALIRTYNSQGLLDDDNADNWRLGVHQRVSILAGTVNTSGSTVAKVFGDGREVLYTYDSTLSLYVSTEGAGAHDTLSYNSSTTQWTWTDGSVRNSETYDNNGRLLSSVDADGNAVSYTYTGTLLTQITDASGQNTYLDYSGTDLTQIRVVSDSETQTITRYSYDSSHRLTQVQVDLSPEDNSIADSDVYTTTYTYDGTSRRVASITQSDGSSVAFTYQLIGGAYRVHTYTDGEGRVTTLTYTDPSGTGGGSQNASADGGVLSTTDIQTTTTNHSLNTGAVSTTDTETSTHDLNIEGLIDGPAASPVVQTYLNDADQVIGTLHADGSYTSYAYTLQGQLATTRHSAEPVEPLWSQDFSVDASGYTSIESGFLTFEDGALTVASRGDVTYGYRTSLGERSYDFDDHVVFRAEINSGEGPSGRHFNIGAQSVDETRWHGVKLEGSNFYAIWNDSGDHSLALGSVRNDVDYVVEVQTHEDGSTLFVYEKGKDRATGFKHELAFTDWGDVQGFFQTLGSMDGNSIDIRLDNLSEAPAPGALVGPWIAAEDPQDIVTYYDDAGRVTGTLQDGNFTTYSYDALGQLVGVRQHDEAPLAPVWAQDFSQDALEFTPLYSGYDTFENSGMTVTSGFATNNGWRTSFGQKVNDFTDYFVYRGEVTTGSSSAGRSFNFGAMNFTTTRVHSAYFGGGKVYVDWYNSGWQEAELGDIEDDTTYVVEVTMDTTGTTLYVYEKGTSRASGYSDHRTYTDWNTTRMFFETQVGPSQTAASMRLDNISIATASGGLVGSLIAVESGTDTLTTGYTIPSGATWQSVAYALYGVNSAAAGTALQTALGNPTLTQGNELTDLPPTLDVTTTTTVAAYYTIPSGATWQSIANTLYGINTAEAGEALRDALDDPPLTAGTRLTGLPTTLSVTTQDTDTYDLDTGEITTPAGTWAAAGLLESSSTPGGSPRVAFDANGNGFAVWRSAGDLFVRRYVRSTDTWQTQVTLDSGSGTITAPELAVDAGGNAIVAWVQSDGTAQSTYTSFYDAGAGTWGTATLVESSSNAVTTTEGYVSVAISGARAAVTWQFQNGDAYVARRSGGSWATEESLESSSNAAREPSVVIDSSGNVLTLWRQASSSAQSTFFNRYDAATSTWSGATLLESSSTATDLPRLTFDGGSKAMAIWAQGSDIIARRYDFTAGTWATAQTIHSGSGTPDAAVVSSDSAGNVVAAWQQSDGTADSIWVSTYSVASSTWTTSQLLETSSQPVPSDIRAVAASMRSGRAAVTWLQSDGTRNDVYAATFAGATWSSPSLLESNNADAALPVVAIDVDGYATVSWQQSDGTANSVYQARFTPGTPYYLVPSGATWQSIANTLYGVNNAEAGAALQTALGDPAITTGAHLTNLPATLTAPIVITVDAYYTVQSGDTWESITETIYGTDDPAAVEALQDELGNPTLSEGLKLTVPMTLTYGEGDGSTVYLQTDVEDALGHVTTYEQDEAGRLTGVLSPTVGGSRLETRYAYDADGNVTSITQDPDGLNRVTALSYDDNGNVLTSRDDLGNTVTRTYNSNNQLLTETLYLVPDPDGAGSGQPSSPLKTRYAYDGENHLRFMISADGRVTEHRYNTAGERTLTLKYTGALYTATNFAESDLSTWASARDLTRLERAEYAYDWRGNVATITAYVATNSSGVGTGTPSLTQFVYDQRGQLLQTIDARGSATTPDAETADLPYATTFTYDGLGRVLTSTQWNSSSSLTTTLNAYDDANRRTTTTLDNGLVTTRTYNHAGELISVANGTSATPAGLGTTTYAYDADGRLRMVTDPTGVRQFHFYDDANREIGTVDGDGSLTELVYDLANHPIKAIRYAALLDSTTLLALVDTNGDPVDVDADGFDDLRTAVSGNAAHDRITRSVYDAGGQLLMTIDETGAITKLVRDGAGRITEEVRYANTVTITRTVDQVLDSDLTITTSANDRHTRRFYDADGNLAGVIDAEGYLTEFVYDAAGHLSQQIAYATQTTGTGTLAELRPALDDENTVTPEQDLVSYFFYDGQGRRIGALDGEGYFTETVYDVAGQVTQAIRYDRQLTYTSGTSTFQSLKTAATATPAPATQAHAFEYDGAGRVVEETDFEGTVTTYVYDDVGNLTSSTRAAGTTQARTPEKRYDRLGRVTQELSAQGHALITGGMSEGDINDIWEQYGVTYAYDAAGRRISATVQPNDTETNKTRYFYDRDGRLRFEVNQLGEVKEHRYDALGQLTDSIAYVNRISVSSLDGGLVNTTLTTRVAAAADAAHDAHTVLTYTTRGQVASMTTAESSATTHAYNTFGEQTGSEQTLTGSTSLEHEYSYDKRGLLTNTNWDPSGLDTTEVREYDAFGRVTQVTDANGNVRRAEYDRLGRTIVTVDALDAERVTTYDAFSRTLTTTDALGNVTEFHYDDTARTVEMTTPEGIVVTTGHNRHGQTLTIEAAGLTTEYSYDLNGQLTSVSDDLGTLESRSYDRSGRQLTSTDARGTTTQLEYDAANRVFSRTVDEGGLALTTEYGYDGQGRVTSVTDPNGVITETTYDRDGRVVEVVIDPAELDIHTTYDYDLGGRLIRVTEGAGTDEQRVVEYEYDALGRRISEVVDPEGLELTTAYSYDDNGNLIRKLDALENETVYVYDAENRQRFVIDALDGLSETLYDANGRISATKRYGQLLDTFEFPEEGPVSVAMVTGAPFYYEAGPVPPADRTERYVYDADGRQVFTINAMGGVTRKEYDDRSNVIRQVMYSQRIAVTDYETVEDVEAALELVDDEDVTNDRESRSVYDLRGRARYTIDGLGGTVAYRYDAAGNVISKIEFATAYASSTSTLTALDVFATAEAADQDRTTRMWYDAANRLRFALDAENYLREKRYDDVGRVTAEILYEEKLGTIESSATLEDIEDEAGDVADAAHDQRTDTVYDAAGRATSVADASGAADVYTYDAVGNRLSFTNKADATWTYVYDANRRLIEEHSPEVSITTVNTVEHAGQNPGYGYNTNLTSATSTGSLITRMEYDALGNVVSRTEAYGRSNERTTQYVYDELGRQVETVFPEVGHFTGFYGTGYGGATLYRDDVEESFAANSTTHYDALGNAVLNQDAGGGRTQRIYDSLGRVRYIVDAERYVTRYSYDTFGNQTEMVRYANKFDLTAEYSDDELINEELAETLLDPDPTMDRVIQTQYDRVNRAVQVQQPEALVFLPDVGQSGGQFITASPTTVNEYNAQGQLVRQSQLVDPTESIWASTYFYYDERGQNVAEIDALGYVTTHEYDAAGNEVRTVQYARQLTLGTWNLAGFAAPPITTLATSPDDPAGYDRITECEYDRLNRKINERLVGLVTSETITGADQVTTYAYDAVGNRTRVTDQSGATTYMYYDVLGRQVATAAPTRDRGDGTDLTPLTRMRRDAFGNLVEQTIFARGADTATSSGFTFTADSADQTTRFMVDGMNRVIETMDGVGNKRFATYDTRGQIALDWINLSTPISDVSRDRIMTSYEYDRLGRQTSVREDQTVGEGHAPKVVSEYNAFGEIVARIEGVESEGDERFEYDQAGRLWRTNSGDGVWKVYLYDLAGRATAEIRSRELELASMEQLDIGELQTQRMRTETRYDLLGRVVEQRSPSFAPANPDGELEVIGTEFQIDDDVLAPSNPDAVYRLFSEQINFGFGNFTYTLPTLDPGATVAEGGGYYYVAPTTGTPNAGWVQDATYHLVSGRYLHWARPLELSFSYGLQALSISFEYRAHGSSGAWTSQDVVALPKGQVGVALDALSDGEFDYRVTYTRANQLQAYAIATGTMELDGGTTSTVDTTLATLAADNITPTSITTTTAVNTEFLDAGLRIGSFSGMDALDEFVYRRVVSGSLVSYVADRGATVAQGGGYYRTASGFVQKSDYTPAFSRSIRWDPPADGDLIPRFEYRSVAGGVWIELGVETVDLDVTTFEYAAKIGTLGDGQYEFRITYETDDSEPQVVATATGTFHIEQTNAAGSLEVETDPADNAGTVATISNRPAGSNDIETQIVSSSGHDTIDSEGIVFTGTNDVLVTFPSFSGAVRVELEYLTRPISAEDDPGPDEEGWPAETRRISLLLSDASDAADGLHLIWSDPDAPSTGGGISAIASVRIYSVAGDGSASLRAASDDADAASIGGTSLSWDAPWNTNVVATFNVRRVGEISWQSLTIDRVGGDYTVDLQTISAGEWEYEVTYTQGGLTRAVTQGMFVSTGGAIANVFEDPGSSPFPIEPVAPASGMVTSPVEFDLISSAEQIVTGPSYVIVGGEMREHQPLETEWDGDNEIELTWADLGSDPVRVVVDYISAPRYSYNYTTSVPPHWDETATYVPGVRTSQTLEFESAATGATLTWADLAGDVGGIQSIQRIRVYTAPEGNWVLKYDRDTAAPIGGASISWPAPDNEEVDATFRIREAGTTTWQTITVDSGAGGLSFADLNGLDPGDYEYEISHSITEASVTTVIALTTGSFTIPAWEGIGPQTLPLVDVTQHNVTFDQGDNDFGPVTWDGEEVAWSQAPTSGDTIEVRTRVLGTSTWQSQIISGSGPDFVADAQVGASEALEFEILYTHSGQSTPYSSARGTLNSAVTSSRTPSVVTVTSQTATVHTDVLPVDITAVLGAITWRTPAVATSDITFRYQLEDLSWQTLTVIGDEEDGYRVDASKLPSGEYRYEVIYKRPSETVPYAIASGEMTIDGSPDGGGLSLEDHTTYSLTTSESTSPNVPTRLQSFDRWGNVLTTTDALGNVTHYLYDQMGHVIRSELPSVAVVDTTDGEVTESTAAPITENMYDLLGRLVSTRDANGNVNSVTYNEASQIIAETHADEGEKAFVYDAFGNQVLVTDELGFRTRNTYNRANRLTSVERELTIAGLGSSATSATYNYTYDVAGRRTAESDGIASTFYRYDEVGNVISRVTARGFETRYFYDTHGNKTGEEDANGIGQSWQYDDFGRLLSHFDLGSVETRYEYDHAGLLVRQTSSLGQDLQYEYDTAGQLVRIVDRGVANTDADVVSSNRLTEYGYDLAGRRTVERTIVDGQVQEDSRIGYDALGRMVEVQDPDFVLNYSYDAAGNRTHIAAEYFNHNGYSSGDRLTQDLWYTYDEMNRVLITQGVVSDDVIDISATQGSQLTYNLRGERTSARTGGEHMELREENDLEFGTTIEYSRHDTGLFTERYGYDGLSRLIWTEQDTPTTVVHPNSSITHSITSVRTNTREYDDASRETLNETFAIDGDGPVSELTVTSRTSEYDADGRLESQATRKNGVMQFRLVYGDAHFVDEEIVSVASPLIVSAPSSGAGPGNAGSVRTLARSTINNTGLPPGLVRIPAHWAGTGFDAAGVLRSYKVEVYRPNDGKYLYATEHKLEYRMGDSYQLIKETADSFTTVHNVALPQHGETTRTYNVNGELVQYSDKIDANKNRYFVNNAQGQALLAVQGNFDGQSGRSTIAQAIAQAVARVGNPSKAQYFFSANGQSLGSFGQLLDEDNEFEANFDVNFTPVSEQFPASTPGEVIVQSGDTLRTIAARVFGDASLWYIIAEENGLTDPDAALEEGTLLRIPNQVLSLSNTAYSFKPFDVSDAIGDTTPTQPTPKKKKKHGLGAILATIVIIIIAVVVTAYLGPVIGEAVGSALGSAGTTAYAVGYAAGYGVGAAVGNAASQGGAIALGVQDEFNWKAVAQAGITGALLPGQGAESLFKDPSFGQMLVQGAVNSSISQGVGIALGLQDSFSWRDVAIGAVSSGVAGELSKKAQQQIANFGGGAQLQSFGANITAGAGSVLVRTAFGGKVDATSVLADVFGNALGSSIADRIKPVPQPASDDIGLTADQYDEMKQIIDAVSVGGQTAINDQLRHDLREVQFQMSVQRDIERSLSKNPEFFANLPMPAAPSFVDTSAVRAVASASSRPARNTLGSGPVPVAVAVRDFPISALERLDLEGPGSEERRAYVGKGNQDVETGKYSPSVLSRKSLRKTQADNFSADVQFKLFETELYTDDLLTYHASLASGGDDQFGASLGVDVLVKHSGSLIGVIDKDGVNLEASRSLTADAIYASGWARGDYGDLQVSVGSVMATEAHANVIVGYSPDKGLAVDVGGGAKVEAALLKGVVEGKTAEMDLLIFDLQLEAKAEGHLVGIGASVSGGLKTLDTKPGFKGYLGGGATALVGGKVTLGGSVSVAPRVVEFYNQMVDYVKTPYGYTGYNLTSPVKE